MAETASGTVVRIDDDSFTERTAFDSKTRTIDPSNHPNHSPGHNIDPFEGHTIVNIFRYRRCMGQLEGQNRRPMSGTSERWQRAVAMRAADPEGVHRLSENVWLVRSQNTRGRYRVVLTGEEWSCDCEDFAKWEEPCKHIYRVQLELTAEICESDVRATTTAPRRTYSQDWPAYDRASRRRRACWRSSSAG